MMPQMMAPAAAAPTVSWARIVRKPRRTFGAPAIKRPSAIASTVASVAAIIEAAKRTRRARGDNETARQMRRKRFISALPGAQAHSAVARDSGPATRMSELLFRSAARSLRDVILPVPRCGRARNLKQPSDWRRRSRRHGVDADYGPD